MLVLSRKVGETLVINENVSVTIVSIDRNKIRLGINAPKDMPVFRQEVFDRIHGEGATERIPTRWGDM